MRARQHLRRRGLWRWLRWEEEPWIDPIHLRKEGWDLLFLSSPRLAGGTLASRFLTTSGVVVLPEEDGRESAIDRPSCLSVPWVEARLLDVLNRHVPQPGAVAAKGGES